MKKVTSFEHACTIMGIDPLVLPVVTGTPDDFAVSTIAFYKLRIIEKATNGDWKPDFSNYYQEKHTPWMDWVPSLSAFVYTRTDCTDTDTHLGARFYFPDRNTAAYFGKQHIELINQLHQ